MPKQDRDFTKVTNVFSSKILALFMVASIHRIQKSTKETGTPKQDGR